MLASRHSSADAYRNWRTGQGWPAGQGRGVGSRRSLMVLVAVVLAAVAAAAVFVWARGLESRAFDDAELVEVFVASAEIPKGTPGEQAAAVAIKASKIPAKFRPSTALTDLATIKGKVALTALSPNTVLV